MTGSTPPRPEPPTLIAVAVGVFLVAFLLRLPGLGWGLPTAERHWSLHPDEPVVLAYSQQVQPLALDFVPGFYNYGTLGLTLNRMATDLVDAYGGGPKARDGSDLWRAMANYHRAGRTLSQLAGSMLAVVVLALLWRRTHWVGAVAGGLAVAVAPGLVMHSSFQTVDVLATFFFGLSLLFALRAEEEGWRAPVLAGLFAGLSAGTKYTGIVALLALFVVCAFAKKWKEAALGSAAALLAFLVTTPGAVLDGQKFWRDFAYEMAHTSEGHGLVFAGSSPGFVFHIGNLAIGFGLLMTALGLFGLGRAAFKRHVWALALAFVFVVVYLMIGRAEVKFLRYTFPLVPILAVGFGWIVGQAHLHPDRRYRLVGALGVLGLAGILGGGTGTTAHVLGANRETDPRDAAAAWLRTETAGKTVALVSDPWFYTPSLYPESAAPRWVPFVTRDEQMRSAGPYRLLRFTSPEGRKDWDVRVLGLQPDFVVFSSFETEGLDNLLSRGRDPGAFAAQLADYKAFQEALVQQFEPAKRFPIHPSPLTAVHDMMYVRPTIWVWKRKNGSPTPSNGSSTTSAPSGGRAATP
ncbi:MAG: glycosyltransferase family 39 protein [Fimbriimonadaceae bacterium]|nr:glycosyltransferase family 39 protein [Fimbriimonadaceae bacterium]QYK58898.1 MAG: glycosyltransferase family 39 protein [Fimbriimonadaceae bacterium]